MKTLPSAAVTPRFFCSPYLDLYSQTRAPVAAFSATTFPPIDPMYMTPSTTTGVPCMLPAGWPGVRWVIQAPPSVATFDAVDAGERRVALIGEVAADQREVPRRR